MVIRPLIWMGLVLALALVRGQSGIDCSDPEARGRALQAEGLWAQAADEFQRAIERCGNDAGMYIIAHLSIPGVCAALLSHAHTIVVMSNCMCTPNSTPHTRAHVVCVSCVYTANTLALTRTAAPRRLQQPRAGLVAGGCAGKGARGLQAGGGHRPAKPLYGL